MALYMVRNKYLHLLDPGDLPSSSFPSFQNPGDLRISQKQIRIRALVPPVFVMWLNVGEQKPYVGIVVFSISTINHDVKLEL